MCLGRNYKRVSNKKALQLQRCYFGVRGKIVASLIEMSEPERNAVVGYAHYKENWSAWKEAHLLRGP